MRLFRADAAFAVPELYKTPGAEGCSCAIRPGKTAVPESRIAPVLKRPAGRPPTHMRRICGDFAYQAASRGKPSWDKSWRVVARIERHPGDLLPEDRLCRHQPADGAGPDHSVLQPARHRRTACRGRKEGGQSDASFLQGHGAERGAASASCIGPQSRCLPAGRRPTGGDGRPVADRPADPPHQDRSAGRSPRPSRHVPTGRGGCRRRSVHPHPCGHPTAPCATATCMTVSAIKPGESGSTGLTRRVPVRSNSSSSPLQRP